MSKSAAPSGTVVMHMRSHRLEHARTRAGPRQWQGFWMFCGSSCGPSALLPARRRGRPCAGYSGFSLKPCPARSIVLEEPRYAMHAPTNHRSLGRLDPAAAALGAVAICDAIRIGFLFGSLKQCSAADVFDGNVANSQEVKTQRCNFSVYRAASCRRSNRPSRIRNARSPSVTTILNLNSTTQSPIRSLFSQSRHAQLAAGCSPTPRPRASHALDILRSTVGT
jgi:hypothetical protein